ncbi:MAG TPA: hypothetical protein VHB79_14275 [Polyangiaceae bacterium]|nr:hypothetical protein [Polyangiaceae bacterium]
MRRSQRLAALLAGVTWSAHALSAPGHSYGFGARSTALAGATSADVGDAGSLFYNPALLARAAQSELALGYSGVSPNLRTNHQDAGVPGVTSLGAAALGRGTWLGIPVAFGLGLSLSNGHLSRVDSLRADTPRWALRDPLPELFDLATALAFAPTRWLALGGGAGFLATTRGSFEVTGTAKISDGQGAEYDSQLRHSVDAELRSVSFPLLGARVDLPKLLPGSAHPLDLKLALTYRGEAKLEQDLRGVMLGDVDAGFAKIPVRYTFDAQSVIAFVPRQVVLGVSGQSELYTLSLDVGFEQWSRCPSLVARSGAHVEANLPPGLPLSLPPDSELAPRQSAGFSDRSTWRVGLERRLPLAAGKALALRGGYAFLPTPVPRSSSSDEVIDAAEHVVSLGAGVRAEPGSAGRLPGGFALDAFALYGRSSRERLERRGGVFIAEGHTLAAGFTLTLLAAPGPD